MVGTAKPSALVTGAARRIGRAIAEMLAADGYRVAVHYSTSQAEAAALVAHLNARFGPGIAADFRADLRSENDVAMLVENVAAAFGGLDVLVNNASIFEPDTAQTATRSSWDKHLDTNLRAPLILSQCFVSALLPGKEGNIVNIIDQRAFAPTPEFFSYTISKTALLTLTRLLAQALAPRVRVNGVAPGPTLKSIHQTTDQFAAEISTTLLRRAVTPDDIAAGVKFILHAPAMTGQTIVLDAGQHLAPWSPWS